MSMFDSRSKVELVDDIAVRCRFTQLETMIAEERFANKRSIQSVANRFALPYGIVNETERSILFKVREHNCLGDIFAIYNKGV